MSTKIDLGREYRAGINAPAGATDALKLARADANGDNLEYIEANTAVAADGAFAAALAPFLGAAGGNVQEDPESAGFLVSLPNDRLVVLEDEFMSQGADDRWGLSGVGSPFVTSAEGDSTETAGVAGVVTSAGANDTAVLTSGTFYANFVSSFEWYVSITAAVSNRRLECGLGRTLTSASFGASAISFVYDSSVDGNWHCLTRDASTDTDTDSGVAVSASTMYKLRVVQPSVGTILFYINGALVATHSTNVPGASSNFQRFGARIEALTASSVNFDADRAVLVLRYADPRY